METALLKLPPFADIIGIQAIASHPIGARAPVAACCGTTAGSEIISFTRAMGLLPWLLLNRKFLPPQVN